LKRKLFTKYAKEVAIGIHELTKKPTNDIERKLLDIVLQKLKIEEQQEAKDDLPEELSDEEIKKLEAKEKKEKDKKTKKSRLETVEGDE